MASVNRQENGGVGGGGGGVCVCMCVSKLQEIVFIYGQKREYRHTHTFIKNLVYVCVGHSFCPQWT